MYDNIFSIRYSLSWKRFYHLPNSYVNLLSAAGAYNYGEGNIKTNPSTYRTIPKPDIKAVYDKDKFLEVMTILTLNEYSHKISYYNHCQLIEQDKPNKNKELSSSVYIRLIRSIQRDIEC